MLDALKIVSESWPLAFMVIGIGAGLTLIIVNLRQSRPDLKHQETMAQIETRHRETMLEINRKTPKLIESAKGENYAQEG